LVRQQQDDGGGSGAHGKTVVYGGAFPAQRGAAVAVQVIILTLA
jgi:hypothetical protein